MKIFILEDDPNRIKLFQECLIGNDVTFAEDVTEGKRLFQPPYDVMFLDHDLGGRTFVDSYDPNTGYSFLQDPDIRKELKDAVIIIHSLNPSGAVRMKQSAKLDGANVTLITFPALIDILRRFEKEG